MQNIPSAPRVIYLEPAKSSVNISAGEGFVENSILLGYDAVSMGDKILIFQKNN
jgi:hypothetical protein